MTTAVGTQVPLPELTDPALLVIGYAGRDEAAVRHHIDGGAYQSGTLAALRVPSDLIARAIAQAPAGDLVIFCGTVPLLAGEFRYGPGFAATMTAGDETLSLGYTMRTGGQEA
jgi:hypothetical protein